MPLLLQMIKPLFVLIIPPLSPFLSLPIRGQYPTTFCPLSLSSLSLLEMPNELDKAVEEDSLWKTTTLICRHWLRMNSCPTRLKLWNQPSPSLSAGRAGLRQQREEPDQSHRSKRSRPEKRDWPLTMMNERDLNLIAYFIMTDSWREQGLLKTGK